MSTVDHTTVSSPAVVSSSPAVPSPAVVAVSLRDLVVGRCVDYLELSRPRIAVLSLLTVALGFALGTVNGVHLVPLLHALFGIGLIAVGSSALNQLLERETDSRMERTANRPLPAGRLSVGEVFLFGMIAAVGGGFYLLFFVNLLTAVLGEVTLLLYVFAYTPLKQRTALCTLVGAIPGALPPVLGWTAAGGSLDSSAFSLFAILFLWQFPHFFAIAWLYRHQYAKAGLRMLPGGGRFRGITGLLAVGYALVLIPVSLLPSHFAFAESLAGSRYTVAALLLSVGYLLFSILFFVRESRFFARALLWASLVYLPLLLFVLTWDHFKLLG